MLKSEYLEIRNAFSFDKRDWRLLLHILIDIAILAYIYLTANVLFLSALGFATLIFRSFALMHDATHSAVSKFKSVNTLVGIFYGGIGLLPFEQWKASHIKHHIWSGNMGKDPVMAFLISYPKMSEDAKAALDFCWKRWIPAIGFAQHVVFWMLSIKELRNNKLTTSSVISIASPVFFWGAVIYFSPPSFLLTTVFPAIYIYLLGAEAINLPHHMQMNVLNNDEKLPVWEQGSTARSCEYPSILSKIVVLNFNLHSAHHMFPDVPWYYLPEIHNKIIKNSNIECDKNFSWIIENRKKKLVEVLYGDPVGKTSSYTNSMSSASAP